MQTKDRRFKDGAVTASIRNDAYDYFTRIIRSSILPSRDACIIPEAIIIIPKEPLPQDHPYPRSAFGLASHEISIIAQNAFNPACLPCFLLQIPKNYRSVLLSNPIGFFPNQPRLNP